MLPLHTRVTEEILRKLRQGSWPLRVSYWSHDKLYFAGCLRSVQELLMDLSVPQLLLFLSQANVDHVVEHTADLLFDRHPEGSQMVTTTAETLVRRVPDWFCGFLAQFPDKQYYYKSSSVSGTFVLLDLFHRSDEVYRIVEPILHGDVVPVQCQTLLYLTLAADVYTVMHRNGYRSKELVRIFTESVELVPGQQVMLLSNDNPECYSVRLALYWHYHNVQKGYPQGVVAPLLLRRLIDSVPLNPTYDFNVALGCDSMFELLLHLADKGLEEHTGHLPFYLRKLLLGKAA